MKFKKSATTKVMTVPAGENHLKFVSNIQNFQSNVDALLIKILTLYFA